MCDSTHAGHQISNWKVIGVFILRKKDLSDIRNRKGDEILNCKHRLFVVSKIAESY